MLVFYSSSQPKTTWRYFPMDDVAHCRVSWFESWVWHRRWDLELRRIAALVSIAACTGCVTIGSHFTVDTGEEDPLIFAPRTAPGKGFNVPLEGFRLGCERRTLETSFGEVELTQSRWTGRNAPIRAHLSEKTALDIARHDRSKAFKNLVKALEVFQGGERACRLEDNLGKTLTAARLLMAAEALIRQLPHPYSLVLRSAYNHRVWNEGGTTRGISLDLSAGMRLRLENSVAIPPSGIASDRGHPSAFAAPTYLYFHTLTARELCDPGSSRNAGHICKQASEVWENRFFLSPSGGLARLGLVQGNANTTVPPGGPIPTTHVRESSSLLDLLERHVGGGTGASTWWRLWLPAHRDTLQNSGLNGGSGSAEALQVPLLLSAESLERLQEIDFATANPCGDENAPQGITCHSLHYRVMPIPEISIRVNGQREWVPVGTTLHDLMAERLHAGFASRVPYMAAEMTRAHDALPVPTTLESLYRAALEGLSIRRFSWKGAHSLRPHGLANATQLARFMRLQLLPGDDIKWK